MMKTKTKTKVKSSTAIIVAGGTGQRFGQDKLLLTLGTETVLEKSVKAFLLPEIDEIIVVCHQDKINHYQQLLQQKIITKKKIKFIIGGAERWQSSWQGIKEAQGDYVLIHDCARPLISQALIKQSLKTALIYGSALVAMPATDSIKLVDAEQNNYQALDRKTIWLAQTPQVFVKKLILQAYQLALDNNYQNMTDESELVTKFLKQKVKIVPSTAMNLKITFPLDLKIARLLLAEK